MFKKLIADQFRRPSGLLGYYALNFMKKNNMEYIEKVCDLLKVEDYDKILEIGCGAGYAIQMIAGKNGLCKIDAVDFSPMMIRKAKRNNRQHLRAGRARFFKGDFGDYDFSDNTYSKIFAINVIYFWKELLPGFSKIHSLLKPHGMLILYMSGPERIDKIPFAVEDVFKRYSISNVENTLLKAGFSNVSYEKVIKNGLDTFFISAEM